MLLFLLFRVERNEILDTGTLETMARNIAAAMWFHEENKHYFYFQTEQAKVSHFTLQYERRVSCNSSLLKYRTDSLGLVPSLVYVTFAMRTPLPNSRHNSEAVGAMSHEHFQLFLGTLNTCTSCICKILPFEGTLFTVRLVASDKLAFSYQFIIIKLT